MKYEAEICYKEVANFGYGIEIVINSQNWYHFEDNENMKCQDLGNE